MTDPASKPSGIPEFEHWVTVYLKPVASDFEFRFEQIDPRLFVLSSETLTIKVYFPECHGYDVDLRVAPTFSRDWYSPQEVLFSRVGQFLGLGDFLTSRRTSTEHIGSLVQMNEGFLRQALPELVSAKGDFWDELSLFIEDQISKESESNGQWADEQRLNEVRQEIDVAWKAKDYAKVIGLSEEIQDKLTGAEMKKVEYARKQAGSPGQNTS